VSKPNRHFPSWRSALWPAVGIVVVLATFTDIPLALLLVLSALLGSVAQWIDSA